MGKLDWVTSQNKWGFQEHYRRETTRSISPKVASHY